MKNRDLIQIGGILFFIGIILIIVSWLYSYPIHQTSITDITFYQYYPSLWPGLVLSFIGLFLIAYYSKNNIVRAICSSIFPLLVYIYAFFFSYIPSSDCGAVRGMFEVFQKTKIDINAISYFQFPTFFSLNEIIHQIAGINEKDIALICFILYGFLLGLFLYLFFVELKNRYSIQLIPFLLVIIYFIGMFSFLNFQWVPQTLALVYFFILIYISTYLESPKIKWKLIFILIFTSLVLTHAFIPIIFLSFFSILTFKKRNLATILLTILSIYLIITVFYLTFLLPLYFETFRQSLVGFGGEYITTLSASVAEVEGTLNQIISFANRLIIPMIWIVGAIGTAVLFLKRKMDFILISLGLAGGIYLAVGLVYSVLGLRSTKFLFIPLTIGFMFFISKWKKPTITVILIILILSVFGPMRMAYDTTQFQTDEEVNACNFLSINMLNVTNSSIAMNQVNYGYFFNINKYLKNHVWVIRPGERGFLNIFKSSLNQNSYILYNSNLGKEVIVFEMSIDRFNNTLKGIMSNNKIYDCGLTYIIKGIEKR